MLNRVTSYWQFIILCVYWFQQDVNPNLDSGTKLRVSCTENIFKTPSLSITCFMFKINWYNIKKKGDRQWMEFTCSLLNIKLTEICKVNFCTNYENLFTFPNFRKISLLHISQTTRKYTHIHIHTHSFTLTHSHIHTQIHNTLLVCKEIYLSFHTHSFC